MTSGAETCDDGFRVTLSRHESGLTVTVDGDFDLAAGALWQTNVTAALGDSAENLDVDLGGVAFMDSSGLGLLVKLHRWAESTGSRLRLLDVPRNVRRVLEFSGVDSLFEMSEAELEPD